MGEFTDKHYGEIAYHLSKYPTKLSALMPILYIAQDEYGHISDDLIREISGIVEADETHVNSVVGFYTMFFNKPHGKYLLQICVDLPCSLAGSEDVARAICDHLGVEPGQTTDDNLFTVQKVVCVGACDHAAVLSVNFEQFEDLTPQSAIDLIENLRRRETPAV